MVDAFKSTLDELTYADLILLVLDCSEPINNVQIKYQSCRETLDQLHINPVKILCVMNKIDLIPRDLVAERAALIRDLPTVSISAKTGEGIRKLRNKIVQFVFEESEVSDRDEAGPKIVSKTPLSSVDQAGISSSRIDCWNLERYGFNQASHKRSERPVKDGSAFLL